MVIIFCSIVFQAKVILLGLGQFLTDNPKFERPKKKEHMTEFHLHINSVCHHIQFTVEEEQDLSLPFLDALVIRHDKTFRTQVYRKPPHTLRYIHFDSHHPQHQKLAVTKTLQDRANIHNTIPADARHETPQQFPLRHSYPIPKVKQRSTT